MALTKPLAPSKAVLRPMLLEFTQESTRHRSAASAVIIAHVTGEKYHVVPDGPGVGKIAASAVGYLGS